MERAAARIREWGWEPVIGRHAAGRWGYLSGTDEQRLADLNEALRDPRSDALWFLRGGYGAMRILDGVDWEALAEHPRPLIGFSDNTAIHLGAQRLGLVTFHGPHPATATLSEFSERGLLRALTDPTPMGTIPFPAGGPARAETLVAGVAEGPLVGGNLSLLAATAGTPYAMRATGAILVLEEVGEAGYRLDRLLSQLQLAGLLEGVAGVAVGAISECPDQGRADLPDPPRVVLDRLGELGVPIAHGFAFGHVDDHWTLPLGVRARLNADRGTLDILEPALEPTTGGGG